MRKSVCLSYPVDSQTYLSWWIDHHDWATQNWYPGKEISTIYRKTLKQKINYFATVMKTVVDVDMKKIENNVLQLIQSAMNNYMEELQLIPWVKWAKYKPSYSWYGTEPDIPFVTYAHAKSQFIEEYISMASRKEEIDARVLNSAWFYDFNYFDVFSVEISIPIDKNFIYPTVSPLLFNGVKSELFGQIGESWYRQDEENNEDMFNLYSDSSDGWQDVSGVTNNTITFDIDEDEWLIDADEAWRYPHVNIRKITQPLWWWFYKFKRVKKIKCHVFLCIDFINNIYKADTIDELLYRRYFKLSPKYSITNQHILKAHKVSLHV